RVGGRRWRLRCASGTACCGFLHSFLLLRRGRYGVVILGLRFRRDRRVGLGVGFGCGIVRFGRAVFRRGIGGVFVGRRGNVVPVADTAGCDRLPVGGFAVGRAGVLLAVELELRFELADLL